jgi:ferric-dicitrate binding protein FerR (iron transport regulator)
MRRRKESSGDRRSAAIRCVLLRNGFALDFWQRLDLHRWLDRYPELRELYHAKEAVHRLCRTRGIDRATHALRTSRSNGLRRPSPRSNPPSERGYWSSRALVLAKQCIRSIPARSEVLGG